MQPLIVAAEYQFLVKSQHIDIHDDPVEQRQVAYVSLSQALDHDIAVLGISQHGGVQESVVHGKADVLRGVTD